MIEEPLKWPQALEILQNFDQAVHNHTDTMNMDYAENGWTYLFFTRSDERLQGGKTKYTISRILSIFFFTLTFNYIL